MQFNFLPPFMTSSLHPMHMMQRTAGLRGPGAAAPDLAYVAAGSLLSKYSKCSAPNVNGSLLPPANNAALPGLDEDAPLPAP